MTWTQSLVVVCLGWGRCLGINGLLHAEAADPASSLYTPHYSKASLWNFSAESDALITSYDFTQFETQLTLIFI